MAPNKSTIVLAKATVPKPKGLLLATCVTRTADSAKSAKVRSSSGSSVANKESPTMQGRSESTPDPLVVSANDKPPNLMGFTRALQFGQHRRPENTRKTAIGQQKTGGERCNTCGELKPPTVSWDEHNISASHVQSLVNKRGYDTAIQLLEKNTHKFVEIRCDLCDTWFNTKLLFNAHKEIETHKQRFQLFQTLLNTAVSTCPEIKPWKRVRYNKIVPPIISKSLKYQKSRKN